MDFEQVKRTGPRLWQALLLLAMLAPSLYFLHIVAQEPQRFSALYPWLLVLAIVESALLLLLIGINIWRLVRQYRSRATGSRLSVRLILTFVVLSVVPVSVVYYFSFDFLGRGIENWFDVRVENALTSALKLSRAALDERMRDQLKVTQRMADAVSTLHPGELSFRLEELREQSGALELTVLTYSGRIVAASNINPTIIVPNQPHETILQQLRQGRDYVGVDPLGGGLQVRTVVRVPAYDPLQEQRVMQLLAPLTERISELAEAVQKGYAQYEESSYLREPLKFSFLLTLSLVLLLTLLGAVWAAFYSARRLVEPIRILAIGTRLVASGDYGKRLPLTSSDELGVLVQSFNDMTQRIAQARDEAERSQRRAESQKAYLEVVLGRLSSGVLVLDNQRVLRTTNAAANQIFGFDLNELVGVSIDDVGKRYPLFNHFIIAIMPYLVSDRSEWREEITFFGASGRQVLMCRGAALVRDRSFSGHVIVFDDVTKLVQAQRDAAWGEVARRLAHEIKNPLTPIQLAAERLRHKFLATMDSADATVLDRSTNTIVQQVEVLKEMVKAFSEYARPPAIKLSKVDINALLDEVLELFRGDPLVDIHAQLSPSLPPIEADPSRIRQLLVNLIKNAIEARAESTKLNVDICTRIVEDAGYPLAELVIEDSGSGVPEELIGRIFEPYVTTKPKGSGLGLPIVKKIVEEHGGAIRVENRDQGGARVVVRFPVEAFAHKTLDEDDRSSVAAAVRAEVYPANGRE